ncbi:MAG TPA: hypothetical protein VLA43_09025, partial [Longimicrobiales bacterium]|nr:hypothetical protein [Longimicrobiales bacterium]
MSRLLLVLRTARHLRPRQIVSRLARRFAPAPRLGNVPPLRTPQAALDLPFLPRRVSYLGEDRFRFLNDEREVPPSQFGAPREGLLWDYNFHYFDGLLAPSPDEDAKREWV